MKLNRIGEVRAEVQGFNLMLPGRNVYTPEENPNATIYSCGKGAKAAGFSPHQWVFLIGNRWYVRIPGHGERGNYTTVNGRWTTAVIPASDAQARILNAA